ncbi:MAG: hypothetical protein EOO27_50840 [Comamonadaceae bacterium]|nr:MAG: hypothetical protein EOO27_50840 [Comamonadaceae bacterium]
MPSTLSRAALTTAQSFVDLSRLLREGAEREAGRPMRDHLALLSQHIESALRLRRLQREPADVLTAVDRLAQFVHQHRRFVTGLDSAWHSLYEMAAYQRALRELTDVTGVWRLSLVQRSRSEPARFDAFEQLAWRTLGEALLLVELYEQADGPSTLASLAPPRPAGLRERVMGWWRVLAG